MPQAEWGALLPEQVADWINFDRDNANWHYEGKNSTSMASRQSEGVAYLWNLLSLHGVALLADEVGMGKTFQALGVAALLWKMKPDAKVLVMAPNRDICAHWRREFNAFVKFHYRHADHCVKNGIDDRPIPGIHECWKLEDLATAVEAQAGHLYLTTIYSLSGLVPQEEKGKDNIRVARANARKIRNRIKAALDGEGFDLVIMDEAHYFRNRNGQSQRVNAAEEFFGDSFSPLTRKALLLTATPSHTHLKDINNILSYFIDTETLAEHSTQTLMQKYALRRFRRMQGNEHFYSKREYRNEKAVSCDFHERPESEMFFALYQKKLVTELGYTRNNKSLLYGFLEGFESPGRRVEQISESATDNEEDTDEDTRKDFSKAPDTKMLARLSEQYFTNFGKSPDHPKYGKLVDMCLPDDIFEAPRDLHEDKHLVFVRRIPSVRELTQRINEAYDMKLATKIYQAWGLKDDDPAVKKWRSTSWSRVGFNELIFKLKTAESDEDEEIENDEDTDDVEEKDAKLGSVISELFVVKKGKNGLTDCSNVSLRFRKSESAFALFLEPASDYISGGYNFFYEYDQAGKNRADYVKAALNTRLLKHEKLTRKVESESREYTEQRYHQEIMTVWSLVYPELSSEQQTRIKGWSQYHPDIAENFANYIKAGFLFASPVMIELYEWFTVFNRSEKIIDVQGKYLNFFEYVKPKLKTSLLLTYFKAAIDTFETLCEKIIDHKPGEWEKEWRALSSRQRPAWYASGESGNRQRLILGFNSPFYPNVLVATSVFQEGVNLHLQCRKVHHYGIAGSPGDNEQRVGRVDRLFGKVNELLKVNGLAELEINYPFLKGSVDEDQVASFIARKFHVEEKMDDCTQKTFDKTVELTRENWREFLRKPVKAISVEDPYEASFDSERLPHSIYSYREDYDDLDIVDHISSHFENILDPAVDKLYVVDKNSHNPNAILLIDPVVNLDVFERRQPVLVEQHFSSEFSALVKGTVYYVSLTSPLASNENLKSRCSDFENKIQIITTKLEKEYPLIRVSIKEISKNSHFYLNARVDLPVFAGLGSLGMLSENEVNIAFKQLKSFSDMFEYELFDKKQDLVVSDLIISDFVSEKKLSESLMSDKYFDNSHGGCWEKINSSYGEVEYITANLPVSYMTKGCLGESMSEQKNSTLVHSLILNSKVPFVNVWPKEHDLLRISISYPSGDFQGAERKLLERWFDYVVPNKLF